MTYGVGAVANITEKWLSHVRTCGEEADLIGSQRPKLSIRQISAAFPRCDCEYVMCDGV